MNKSESKYFNTSKKMDDALISLLEKKDFSYITIKDICKEAKVNRSTFYLHYENINDLLEEVIYNLNESFNTHFKDINPLNSNFISDEYLIPYLNFIKENKNAYKALKENPRLFSADSYMKETLKVINPILDKYQIKNEEKEYILKFYIDGLNSLVLHWCYNDCDLEINELILLIKKLVLK